MENEFSILNDGNLTEEQKAQIINQYYENYKTQLDEELKNYIFKQYLGAALQIGSAALPAGISNIGNTIGKEFLKKYLGREISENISSGILSGAASGGMFGLGESLTAENNPILSALSGLLIGGLSGGALGALGSNTKRMINGKQLKNYGNIDELSESQRKNFNNDAKQFYKDYIQEIELNKNGNIEFSRKGIQEQLRWNPHQAQNLSELLDDIKHAQRLPDIPNFKTKQKPNVSHYEVYRGKNGDHYIEVSNSGKRRYYITKDTPTGGDRSTRPAADKDIKTSEGSPDYILNNAGENYNGQMGDILYGGVEMNANPNTKGSPTGYAANIDKNQTEKKSDKSDLYGYENPLTGSSHIYTREEVGAMSPEEFEKCEKEIMAQVEAMKGKMPSNKDLQNKAMNGDGVIYVNSYTRADGTPVKGYFRSLPNI